MVHPASPALRWKWRRVINETPPANAATRQTASQGRTFNLRAINVSNNDIRAIPATTAFATGPFDIASQASPALDKQRLYPKTGEMTGFNLVLDARSLMSFARATAINGDKQTMAS